MTNNNLQTQKASILYTQQHCRNEKYTQNTDGVHH